MKNRYSPAGCIPQFCYTYKSGVKGGIHNTDMCLIVICSFECRKIWTHNITLYMYHIHSY